MFAREKAMAPHSSTLAWKIPWTEEPGRLQSMGLLRVGHNWAPSLSLFTFMHWRRKWQTHSSVLAWRIPGLGEPGGLPSMGSHRVGHDWSDLAAAGKNGTHKQTRVLWAELCPPNSYVEVWTPSMTALGDRACKEVIKWSQRLPWSSG